MERWLLELNFLGAALMTGIIWFVQVVHYPLFGRVGAEGYSDYSIAHQQRTTFVVGGPMLLEAIATGLLLAGKTERALSVPFLAATGLLLVVWISTAVLQIPLHEAMKRGFDAGLIRRLVLTNWIRTICWSARVAILGIMLRTGIST